MLVGRFGSESVFKDVDDIEPGDDFVDKITGAVAACDVLLALIGTQWLTMTDDRGRRRLDNPEDFVRLEIRAALSRGVRVVPILVDGAKMPSADQLPEEMVPLTRRQAVEINPIGFNTDRLLTTLAATFAAARSAADTSGSLAATPVAPEFPPVQPGPSRAAWVDTAPDQPAVVLAGEPAAAVPDEPPVALPDEPAVALPDEPAAAVPDEPPVALPDEPAVALPDEPAAAVPDEPPVALPDEPAVALPDEPAAAVPDEPPVALPDEPAVALPDEPSAAVPDEPPVALPDEPAVALPDEPAVALPDEPAVALPDEPAAVPDEPPVIVPDEPAAVVLDEPAEVVNQPPAVTDPPLAAALDQPSAAAPEPPVVMPDEPAAAVPEGPPVALPHEPASAVPDESPVAIPDVPAAIADQPPVAVPDQPAAVPDQPAAVPDQPAAVPDQPAAVPGQPAAAYETPPPPPPPEPTAAVPPGGPPGSRRSLVVIAAGAVVVLLVGTLLVLRPWASPTVTGGVPAPTNSLGPSTPSTSGSPGAGGSVPLILAHRGGLEVHQFETEQAMEAAAAAGFSIETDVRYTADGVAVLVHDEKATKGLDCAGRSISVSKTTWADLDKYCKSKPTAKDPTQYPVPRLDNTLEGIAAASDQAMVFLEVKTEQTAAQRTAFLDAPAKVGLRDRTVVTSFNRDWLQAIAKADPATKRMLFVSGEQVPASALGDLKLWAVGVEQGVATKQYVDDLKAIGVKVMIWTLNDPKQWTTFFAYNPDVMMTDYPAKLKAWLANR